MGKLFGAGGFAEGGSQHVLANAQQVEAGIQRFLVHAVGLRLAAEIHGHGVEEYRMHYFAAGSLHRIGKSNSQRVDAAGDAVYAFGAVIHRIHTGQVGQQHLRSTNIGIGFFAADMLLAGLQRHAQRLLAGSIHRYADDAAGGGAFVFVFKREVSSMRAAEAHRDAEALGAAQGNVGT